MSDNSVNSPAEINDQEKEEFVHLAVMITAVSFGVITVAQIATMVLFFIRSRKLKEIKLLPKVMMLLALWSTVIYFIGYTLMYLEVDITIMYYMGLAFRSADMLNYGLLFRLVRLQNQLKASEENSKIILAAIQRSRKFEKFVYADLLVYQFAMLIYYSAKNAMDNKEISASLMKCTDVIRGVTFAIFTCVFCP